MSSPGVDLIVLGGGIHGAGVAFAAAVRGFDVRLIESRGIADQTSRWSSKLIHGGLRYLENFEFGLVRESLAERERLCRVAPQLVERIPFIVPVDDTSSRSPWKIRAGLSLYALLGGLGPHVRFRAIPRRDWGSLDGLATDTLRAVFQYTDARTDDRALTRAVARAAEIEGATLSVPARFVAAEKTTSGYDIRVETEAGTETVAARAVVDATGPWIPETRARVEATLPPVEIDLVQGAHAIVPGTLERGVYYFESPRARPMFAIPWKGRTLVGTTESGFGGEDRSVPRAKPEEIEELREGFARRFPDRPFDVEETFAGLRVLPRVDGSFNRRKRETSFVTDGDATARWVSIVGGKLTTFLPTALRALEILEPAIGRGPVARDPREVRIEPAEPSD